LGSIFFYTYTMKHFLKKAVFRILGQDNYLKLLSFGYKTAYRWGLLKNNNSYKYHYFSKNFIEEGNTVIDIGANLGYYTMLFAQWTGRQGKVIAVEPVPDFFKILKANTKQFSNITYFNYALGTEEKEITMVVPNLNGYLRTGLANVQDGDTLPDENKFTFKAQMKKAAEIFNFLDKIDFIKMDIEGYEEYVLPEMETLLQKHKPLLQLETDGTHRPVVEKLLHRIGYLQYELLNNSLVAVTDFDAPASGDYIFIHSQNESKKQMLSGKGILTL
jgi:FkbM family methyltransferase